MNCLFRSALVALLLATIGLSSTSAASPSDNGFIVMLHQQLDLGDEAASSLDRVQRLRNAYARLTLQANTSQARIRSTLDQRGVAYRPFWIVNAIWVQGDAALREELADFPEVATIRDNKTMQMALPERLADDSKSTQGTVPWNLSLIEADDVWDLGNQGEGIVVASADTGVFYQHIALVDRYRGSQGAGQPQHDYNWFDGYCDGAGCGSPLLSPADPQGHGTHTVGSMVGGAPGDSVGVAPGAKWIACRNMDSGGNGTPATYLSCFQWFLAPTTVDGNAPDPALAPHVVNNSWACPPSEGCDAAQTDLLDDAVDTLVSAGIVVVAAAGNSGSGCGSVNDPPATFEQSLTVGSITSSDVISSFSSRGPVTGGAGTLLKPEIVAPGSSVRSTVTSGGYGTSSGTSMASPHIAGVVALMLAQDPSLSSDPGRLRELILASALPKTSSQGCGGLGPTEVPNHVYGHGRVDAYQAVIAADTLFFSSF